MQHLRLRRHLLAMIAAGLTTALLVSASPSSAGDGRVRRHGACSGRSEWTLEVRKDDGRLRVRFELEGGASGQKWNLFLSDNGVGFYTGSQVSGADGHVEVRRRTRDRAGDDSIRAEANNIVSGERCRGKVNV
jgi:outer membrane protein assembly factor BamB